jgi:hypothetical protein
MTARAIFRAGQAGALVVTAAVLAGCGSGSKALIPTANAGLLQNDFANVEQFVAAGNCTKARGWIASAQRHLAALPSTVNAGLLAQLRAGVADLATSAQNECAQNATTSTSSTTTQTSSSSLITTVSSSTPTSSSSSAVTTSSSSSIPTPTTTNPSGGVSPVTTSTAAVPPTTTNQGGGNGVPGGNGNGVGGAGAP